MMEVKGLEKVHYCSVLKEEKGGEEVGKAATAQHVRGGGGGGGGG